MLSSFTDKFALSRSKFNNDKDKAGTGRRVLGSVLGRWEENRGSRQAAPQRRGSR